VPSVERIDIIRNISLTHANNVIMLRNIERYEEKCIITYKCFALEFDQNIVFNLYTSLKTWCLENTTNSNCRFFEHNSAGAPARPCIIRSPAHHNEMSLECTAICAAHPSNCSTAVTRIIADDSETEFRHIVSTYCV